MDRYDSKSTVPFYSQIVNWNGEDSGFPNSQEIENWQNNCCGVACLRMVLSYAKGIDANEIASYWDLIQLGLELNAYGDRGWIHRGLLEMAETFGLNGTCHRSESVEQLMSKISHGYTCIVSVTKGFLGGQPDENTGKPYPTGGHLVVAFDVETQANKGVGIVCNHPSSYPAWNRQAWTVELEKWYASFSGNYIAFRT